MSVQALYPVSFDADSPSAGAAEYLHDSSLQLLVAFFRNKGRAALAQEDQQETWYCIGSA